MVIINYYLSYCSQHLLEGRQLSYHASANAIDYNRIMSTFHNHYENDDSVNADIHSSEDDSDEEEFFDENEDFDEDEEDEALCEKNLDETKIDETENPFDRNPFPQKSKWINTGYELCRLVFGPHESSLIQTCSYKLSHIHDNLYEMGSKEIARGNLVVPIPKNRRNVIQDAIRSWNIVQEFKNLE